MAAKLDGVDIVCVAITVILVITLGIIGVRSAIEAYAYGTADDALRVAKTEYPDGIVASGAKRIDTGVFVLDLIEDGKLVHCVVDVPDEKTDCFER